MLWACGRVATRSVVGCTVCINSLVYMYVLIVLVWYSSNYTSSCISIYIAIIIYYLRTIIIKILFGEPIKKQCCVDGTIFWDKK